MTYLKYLKKLHHTTAKISMTSIFYAFIITVQSQPYVENCQTSIGSSLIATVDKPTNLESGDLLIFSLSYQKGSADTFSNPEGCSPIKRVDNGTNIGIATFCKEVTSSEPDNYSFTFNSSTKWSLGVCRITNACCYDITSIGSNGNSKNPVAPSIITTSNNNLILSFYANKIDATYTLPESLTEHYDSPNTNDRLPSNCVGSYLMANAGITGSKTAIPTVRQKWATMQIALKPGTSCTPLKIDWLSFELSSCKKNLVCLNWETSIESTNDYFRIQRSNDLSNWKTIAQINCDNNELNQKTYSYSDNKPLAGRSYYRIIQIDLDGISSISQTKTRFQRANTPNNITIHPNPTADWMIIDGIAPGDYDFTIINGIGQNQSNLLKVNSSNGNKINLATSNLAKGIHFLLINDEVYKFYKN